MSIRVSRQSRTNWRFIFSNIRDLRFSWNTLLGFAWCVECIGWCRSRTWNISRYMRYIWFENSTSCFIEFHSLTSRLNCFPIATPWAAVVPRNIRKALEALLEQVSIVSFGFYTYWCCFDDDVVVQLKNFPARIRQYDAFGHVQRRVKVNKNVLWFFTFFFSRIDSYRFV